MSLKLKRSNSHLTLANAAHPIGKASKALARAWPWHETRSRSAWCQSHSLPVLSCETKAKPSAEARHVKKTMALGNIFGTHFHVSLVSKLMNTHTSIYIYIFIHIYSFIYWSIYRFFCTFQPRGRLQLQVQLPLTLFNYQLLGLNTSGIFRRCIWTSGLATKSHASPPNPAICSQ